MDDDYRDRLDALGRTWELWARLGDGLTDEQWTTATRCPTWDVAALYAHHSAFPGALSAPPPLPDGPVGEPVTAVEVLRRFNNAPGEATDAMAAIVADAAVAEAGRHGRRELVDRFGVVGPRALQALRGVQATALVPWPAAHAVVTMAEALRIVTLEAVVHLLDVQRALDLPPSVPASALHTTARLLAELCPPVEFVEAATGRSPSSPLPVLR